MLESVEPSKNVDFQRRREIACELIDAARISTMSMLPFDVQKIIQAIPNESGKNQLLDQIGHIIEVHPNLREQPCFVLAGMFVYAFAIEHFSSSDLNLLTRFRTELCSSEDYFARGPFVYTSPPRDKK